uniref:Tyrosine-protein kinase n=1 Tax=Cynoglossus semilaevis TaxID=244447 RepID=A0A3P8WN14_CYNSE
MDLSEEESAPLVIRGRGGSQRSSSSTGLSLQVHLHLLPNKDETTIYISCGQITAEEVCIQAGKKCGILPVYLSLFGLASSDLSFWYPPSHVFHTDEKLLVHFRVRFFFGNWFLKGPRASHRYSLSRDSLGTVLDCNVIDYLFEQSRSDFIASEAGVAPPLSTQEECLGLAVLDLWRMAKEQHQSVRELCRTVSYKSCLPTSHRHDIQKRNCVDRFRIRNTLKKFLKKVGNCSADECSLKLKYLTELASIEPSLGSETFNVDPSTSESGLIRVSGETGIQISGSSQNDGCSLEWQTFCDFQEIVDISIKRVCLEHVPLDSRVVTITRKDDRCLEARFQDLKEALSFVSLIDGYFRLTTDSSYYFWQDVAPPSILECLQNHCHAIFKHFICHLSDLSFPKTYDNFFLTVCVQTPLGLDYKDCLIIKNDHYRFPGVQKLFPSLRKLTNYYQHNKLLLADVPVKLQRCCPPRPKELTNLIIMRSCNSLESQSSPTPERNNFSHIQFNIIKYEDLKFEVSLGQGSFTRIFKGYKTDVHNGEKHVTEVLLKELDVAHKNSWELFFEAASLMSQVSHKHLLHVHGISVHGAKNIMVQEFVKYGALDLYLKRRRSVSVSWKLDLAKQLASVLNFLEDKNIIHGNICAKNLLLAREGDLSQGSSPFIKLSDPGINVALLGEEVIVDRIPWVAPEILEKPESMTLDSDKWSFGATVWEIFNNGEAPLRGWDLELKRQFYESFQQLPPSQWTELADLISQCMNYQPDFRPSCHSIIRQLNSLITSDYVILQATEPVTQNSMWKALRPQQHHTLFEERHLRYMKPLGKGTFGSVELCRYDPLGDNTGELVAVKKLLPNKQSTQEDFQKEINTLSVLHCDYIVKYRGVCYSMGRLSMSLVMEYLPHGSLIGYMDNNKHKVNTGRMLLFASQICKGMEYLQTLRYVHRDLAARNILVANEVLVKITDFGLSKIIPFDKEYYKITQPGESPIFWYAPESINEYKFSHKSDVWSFGVVLHELFSYCNNACNPKRLCMQEIGPNVQGASISLHLANILKNNWRLPAPPNCPPMVYNMMKQCWVYNSEERPSFYSLGIKVEELMMQEDKEAEEHGRHQ